MDFFYSPSFWTKRRSKIFFGLIFWASSLVPLLAQKPSGTWKLVQHVYSPIQDSYKKILPNPIFGNFLPLGRAESYLFADGNLVVGAGTATDHSFLNEVQAVAVGTGVEAWLYEYKGKGTGEAELGATVKIFGQVSLLDPDASAMALGFAECHSNLFEEPLVAVLDKSMASTVSEKIGDASIAFKGLHLKDIPITIGKGKGFYPDRKQNLVLGVAKCVNSFFLRHRSRGYILVWANGSNGFDEGTCEAGMAGFVWSHFDLRNCPK